MKPTFLYIGPDKSGSTWMYEILKQHPQSYVPVVKDIYFFDRYYHKGTDWYYKFFRDVPDNTIAAGELSHDYLYSPEAANRIKADLPNVKLITSLRDPVERSFSNYLYLVRSGLTSSTYEKALDKFDELVDNSLYHKHLSVFFNKFSSENIKVLWFEDLKRDPSQFAQSIFEFLGMDWDEGVGIDYGMMVLPAARPRIKVLGLMSKVGADLFRAIGIPNVVGKIKYSPLTQLLFKPYSKEEKPTINPETADMLRRMFREDVLKLQDLLQKNLSDWL